LTGWWQIGQQWVDLFFTCTSLISPSHLKAGSGGGGVADPATLTVEVT
jgi:hypothetical protein